MKTITLLLAMTAAAVSAADSLSGSEWVATNAVMRGGREASAFTTVAFGTNAEFTILRSYMRPLGTPLLLGTKTTGVITEWQTNRFATKEEVWPEILHPSATLIRKGVAVYGYEMKYGTLVLWDDHGTTNRLFRKTKPEPSARPYGSPGAGSPSGQP